MGRKFEPISVEDLQARVTAAIGDGDHYDLIEKLGADIKVRFDLENFDMAPGGGGPQDLLGYHTLRGTNFTYLGCAAGGDWEYPVFFVIYWDGTKLRAYIPTDGNLWNTRTRQAYGNDEEADKANIDVRWPGRPADMLDHDSDAIVADIAQRMSIPELSAPASVSDGVTSVLADVAAERVRQRAQGYDAANDDQYTDGELADVAALLLFEHAKSDLTTITVSDSTWANTLATRLLSQYAENPRQLLVVIAALLVAEIERRDRASAK